MTQIDSNKPVMITGATGYVAGWIVKRLLDDGVIVHAAVRDPSNTEKLQYLNRMAEQAPGSLEYFASNLLTEGSYAAAMQGCELVFHTASPFTVGVENPLRDLVEPAQLGTRNVLQQATRTESVKRVVVTSSVAAIYGDNADLRDLEADRFTEEHWNTSSSLTHQAYSYSKTLGEREAWKIAEGQDRWDLVTINPSFVLGPGLNPFATSESFSLMKKFGDGSMKTGVPNFGVGAVDVRDVAEAHMRAGVDPAAQGRYIVSGHDSSFSEFAEILRDSFGDEYPIPKRTMPKWLVWLVAPLVEKSLTRRMVARNVEQPWHADNGRSIRELGIRYRPLETSLVDMFQQLIDYDLVRRVGDD
jgi:nucleoside-diphosphate-sugar epimerase